MELQGEIFDKILKTKEEYSIDVCSVHPCTSSCEPFFFFSEYERRFYDLLEFYKRYFDVCNKLDSKLLIIHGMRYQKRIPDEEYFERFLRIQGAVSTMQAELQDLKSIFKLYFEQGGQPIVATTGESLVYHHKQGFNYDFSLIKDTLEEIGALEKAVKLNSGFIDRLVNGRGLDEETKEKLRSARIEISTTKNIQVVKPDKHSQNN